ncbi:MAG: NADAR domain-containing protein [Sulfobacillus sp.]
MLFYSESFLSNFHTGFPIVVAGKTYATSEHYFQAAKYLRADAEFRESVRTAGTPAKAYFLGRQKRFPFESRQSQSPGVRATLRKDWDRVRDLVMHLAVWEKFRQHPKLAAQLAATGERPLVEHTARDCYWADGGFPGDFVPRSRGGTMRGENRLGTILEFVRAQVPTFGAAEKEVPTQFVTDFAGPPGADWTNWLVPGKFLIGAYPVDWLECLRGHVDLIFSLMQDNEDPRLPEYRERVRELGIELREFPIRDRSVTGLKEAIDIAREVCQELFRGRRIYLHCRGGKGRTGTIAGIVLMLLYGMNDRESMRFMTERFRHRRTRGKMHPTLPQTRAQIEQLVAAWGRLIELELVPETNFSDP